MTHPSPDTHAATMAEQGADNVVDLNTVSRKLTAILYADVVGYSALSYDDEDGTHARLLASLDAVTKQVEEHSGRVVNYAGDAILADFPTASTALACAFDIQSQNTGKSAGTGSPIQYRIGVNLGEVILDRNDMYGDSVNIAARIQGLAHPGGISISQAALTAVGHKLPYFVEDLGPQDLKNIGEPVHVFRIARESDSKLLYVRSHKRRYGLALAGGIILTL